MWTEVEEQIALDLNSFKALASETRVQILKKLDKRRATASELSKSLRVSVQGVSQHLNKMESAGLIERTENGRKWVYFELTDKGRRLLHPESQKGLWVVLGLSLLAFAWGAFNFVSPAGVIRAAPVPGMDEAPVMAAKEVVQAYGAGEAATGFASPDVFYLSLIVVGALVFGVTLVFLLRARKGRL